MKYSCIKETLDLGLTIKTDHGYEIQMVVHEMGHKLYNFIWREWRHDADEVVSGCWRHSFPVSQSSDMVVFYEDEMDDTRIEWMLNKEHEEEEIRNYIKMNNRR